jgi:hypothetical protein
MTSFTAELEQEAQITSRVLGRVPEDKLTWKPHPQSMTLGQLALHTATIPAAIAGITANDTYELDPSRFGKSPQPASAAEITKAFEDSLAAAKSYLDGLSAEKAEAIWHVKTGDREIMAWQCRANGRCAASCSITSTTIADSYRSICVCWIFPCPLFTGPAPTRVLSANRGTGRATARRAS